MQALVEKYQDAEKKGTSDADWSEFLSALENAKYILGSDRFTEEDVEGGSRQASRKQPGS